MSGTVLSEHHAASVNGVGSVGVSSLGPTQMCKSLCMAVMVGAIPSAE